MRLPILVTCLLVMLCLPMSLPTTVLAADEQKPVATKPEKAEPAEKAKTEKAKSADAKKQPAAKPKSVEKAEPAEKAKTEKAKTADAKKQPAAKPKFVKKSKPATPRSTVVKIVLNGDYSEGPAAPGMFGEMTPSLGTIVGRLDAAAADKDVAAVWLRIDDLQVGRGKINELRGAIARVRKAGKPVFAEISTAETGHYLLAIACDQVAMPSSGVLLIPGVRMEITYYKGLLDKLGLQFDALKMGKYKGAAEPLSLNEMSKPLRESYEAIAEDIYDDIIATIVADRRLKDYQVKTYIDQGLFTAADAKRAGLIDEVLYSDQLEEAIKQRLKLEKLDIVTNYKVKKVDTDFSGFSGMMKLMEMMMGGKSSTAASTKPKIAVVYAVGQIVEGKSTDDMFGNQSAIGSANMVTALRTASDDPKVVGVVLRIDSPGGSATGSDLIWRETVRLKKPLIASMSDVAGSGGYYIAMGAKKVFAAPETLTGSIGVIGGKLVTGGLNQKLGMNTEVISRGANSGAMSSLKPFTPAERKAWLAVLEETYRQFVGKAAEGRKMPFSKLEEMAQGRVYTGRMAKKLGLVDELGTLKDAIAAAKVAAGLKADAEVELLVLPEQKSFFERMFEDPSAESDFDSLLPELFQLVRQTRLLRQLLSERLLLWMPYTVRVK
ncbi:MAG: signal peptide peptidase SppA [Thermoguttaceae bacterium]